MFIDNQSYDLTNKISVDSHKVLQAGPHSSAGSHHGFPQDVEKHHHDRGALGLLRFMRLPLVFLFSTVHILNCPTKPTNLIPFNLWMKPRKCAEFLNIINEWL